MAEMQNWTYCVVGNIKKTHFDEDGVLRHGTAAFTGGTKVYLSGRLWDRTQSHIDALGLNRRNELQVVWTDVTQIENVRFSRVFQPSVLEIMDNFEFCSTWWGKSKKEKADAEEFVEWWNDVIVSGANKNLPPKEAPMEFTFTTQYDARALTAMARALRKTVRRKHSRRSHLFGWVVVGLDLLLLFGGGFEWSMRSAVSALAGLAILIALLFEDRLNGAVAKKRMLPGTEQAATTFTEADFTSVTAIGTTQWNYDTVAAVAESADYFVFLFSANHAQLFDKRSLQGGTVEEFRAFLTAATGKPVLPVN